MGCSWCNMLKQKIKNNSIVVGIVGLGYVGLPLAVAFSKKFNVIGFDTNVEKINFLKDRISYIEDISNCEIDLNKLHPTNNPEDLKDCDFIIITVPTPLRNDRTPDLSYIKSAAKTIGKILKPRQFIILESTTYPGTTEDVLVPILEKESGFIAIKDFGVAYSPERVDPNNKKYKIEHIPKVVGGLTPEFTDVAVMLYKTIIEKVTTVRNCKTAEAVKMLENVFRNINIALVNELALIFEKMGIDIWEVIEAAKTKPYGFMAFYPGPGVGGHCIPLDPYYLAYISKRYGIIPKFIETAGEINNYMPIHVVNLTEKGLIKLEKTIKEAKVVVLGLTYKPDVNDTRESPAIRIIEELVERGAKVKVYDPYVKQIKTRMGIFHSENLEKIIMWSDAIILAVNHNIFIKTIPNLLTQITNKKCVVVDTKNILSQTTKNACVYIKLGSRYNNYSCD